MRGIVIFVSCVSICSISRTANSCQQTVVGTTDELRSSATFELLPEIMEGARKNQFPRLNGDGLFGKLGTAFAIYFLALQTAFPDVSAGDHDFLPPQARAAGWIRSGMQIRMSATCIFGRDAVALTDPPNATSKNEGNSTTVAFERPFRSPVFEAFCNKNLATSQCLVLCEIPVERDGDLAIIRMTRALELHLDGATGVEWRLVSGSDVAIECGLGRKHLR